jgi:hypothetical protein
MSDSYQSGSRAPDRSNIIKILVATDIHLGYAEKNPIKAEDSFNTFDEILKIGIEEGKLCQDTKHNDTRHESYKNAELQNDIFFSVEQICTVLSLMAPLKGLGPMLKTVNVCNL